MTLGTNLELLKQFTKNFSFHWRIGCSLFRLDASVYHFVDRKHFIQNILVKSFNKVNF